jgi:hypothetical protein
MKAKTFFLATFMFVFFLICSSGIHAQNAKSNLDQTKLMQQLLGKWETNVGMDTVEVWDCQQYGKSYINTVSLVIKGKKSPLYVANNSIDSKEGNIKGFNLNASGDYITWIGSWTTEKKFSLDLVQNFRPETVTLKGELLFETPSKMTFTFFNTDGIKTGENKYNKVK